MAKRRFELNEQQDKELQRAYSQAQDGSTRTRLQAVRMYGRGYPVPEILEITGSNRTSLMEWCRKFRHGGVASLGEHRGGPARAKLKPEQVAEMREKLRQYRPYDLFGPEAHTANGQHWTVEDLARAVQHWYGVSWKPGLRIINCLSNVVTPINAPRKTTNPAGDGRYWSSKPRLKKSNRPGPKPARHGFSGRR